MAEYRYADSLTLHGNLCCSGMAGCTVTLDGKGCITIMTRTTIFALIHGGHGHFLAVHFGNKQVWMALITGVIHAKVGRVAENCLSDLVSLPFHLARMTTHAIIN